MGRTLCLYCDSELSEHSYQDIDYCTKALALLNNVEDEA